MQAVILAAGKGTRLEPISLTRSKAMMPIAGKPIVERVMEDIAAHGVEDFILIVSSDDHNITNYFQNESKLGVEVRFVEQPERKGMAHALGCAAPLVRDDFILSACDNLISRGFVGKMLKLWQKPPSSDAVLSLMEVAPEQLRRSSAVSIKGEWITGIVEKPDPETAPSKIASLPLYCFSTPFLQYLPKVKPSPRGEYELQDAIQMMIDDGAKVRGLQVERRLTLTTAADLLAINRHYLIHGDNSEQASSAKAGTNTKLLKPLLIEENTIIGSDCEIGPNVYIERNCRIGNGVKIRDAVILRDSHIPDGKTISDEVVMP